MCPVSPCSTLPWSSHLHISNSPMSFPCHHSLSFSSRPHGGFPSLIAFPLPSTHTRPLPSGKGRGTYLLKCERHFLVLSSPSNPSQSFFFVFPSPSLFLSLCFPLCLLLCLSGLLSFSEIYDFYWLAQFSFFSFSLIHSQSPSPPIQPLHNSPLSYLNPVSPLSHPSPPLSLSPFLTHIHLLPHPLRYTFPTCE